MPQAATEQTQVFTAFKPTVALNNEYMASERYFWEHHLKHLTEITMFSISKQFLLTALINNYRKLPITDKSNINIYFSNYRRIDNPDTIINYIKNHLQNHTMLFIQKTSISGRQISYIKQSLNEATGIWVTEKTATSLYLQTDHSHPVRVFKITTDNTTTYCIIGTNHLCQNAFYTCLALTPNWYPDLLEGIDQTRKEALINLYKAIGRMDNTLYDSACRHCLSLCFLPEEQPIDFASIPTLLQIDIETLVGQKQQKIQDTQREIDTALRSYEHYNKELQRLTAELTSLLAEPKTDNEHLIKDAQNCKSIIKYTYNKDNGRHIITIKSKMIIDSKSIVTKILHPNNETAQTHYNIHTERARKLLEDLWLNEKLQLFFCTTFQKLPAAAIPKTCQIPARTLKTKNTMPNPHLIHYACFGSNKKQLIDAANNNNLAYYLGALTACNSNLNTGDATVLRKFCTELLSNYADTPVLYDVENKTFVTPRERMLSYETV